MNNIQDIALIEAILFLETEAISTRGIAQISNLNLETVQNTLENLQKKFQDSSSGLELIYSQDTWQIIPKRFLWDRLYSRYGKGDRARLSQAAMETLSIIAYSQPITRIEIEGIRGVSSDSMIRLLLNRNLIQEMGKKDVLGRPLLYGTTKEFLKVFQLASISALPKLDEIDALRFSSEDNAT